MPLDIALLKPGFPLGTRREGLVEKPAFFDTWKASQIASGFSAQFMVGLAGAIELPPDPNFEPTPEFLRKITEGIPREWWPKFDKIESEAQGLYLSHWLRTQVQAEEKLSTLGPWSRFGSQLLFANALDPIYLSASALTEGAAAKWIYSTHSTRLARAAKIGFISAIPDTTIASIQAADDPRMDIKDVAFTAAASFLLPTALEFAFPPQSYRLARARLTQAAQGAKNAIESGQFRDMGVSLTDKGTKKYKEVITGALSEYLEVTPEELNALKMTTAELERWAMGLPGEGRKVTWDIWDYVLSEPAFVSEAKAGRRTQRKALGILAINRPMIVTATDSAPELARAGRMLARDLFPDADGLGPTNSATEALNLLQKSRKGKIRKVYEQAFKAWRKENGEHALAKWKDEKTFRELCGIAQLYMPGEFTADPNVNAVSNLFRNLTKEDLGHAVKAGVPGLGDVADNLTYRTRIYNVPGWDGLSEELGEDNAVLLFANAWLAKHPDETIERAVRLAKGVRRNTRARALMMPDFLPGRPHDPEGLETLAKILKEEHNLPDEEIEYLLGKVTGRDERGNVIARAMHRLDIDETYSFIPLDADGKPLRTVSFHEILENDGLALQQHYQRQIFASVMERNVLNALTPKGRKTPYASFSEFVNSVRDKYAMTIQGGEEKKAFENAVSALNAFHRTLMGRPVDEGKLNNKWWRRLRKMAYMPFSGGMGVAQIPEFGNVAGEAGLHSVLRRMPGINWILDKAKKGRLSQETLEELQIFGGYGTDDFLPSGARITSFGEMADPMTSTGSKFDRFLDRMQNVSNYINLLHPINKRLQQISGECGMQKLAKSAFAKRPLSTDKLMDFALTPQMADRVYDQISKHSTTAKGQLGIQYRVMNFENWTDQEAAAKAILGVSRWSRRVVQEPNIGDFSRWMTSDMAKVFLQFRNFTIGSVENQLGYNIHRIQEGRVLDAVAPMSAALVSGSLVYIGWVYMNSIGREDRATYLHERLSPGAIAKGAIQRAGWTSIVPAAVDTASFCAGFDPVFNDYARTTGLKSDALLGNPTFEMLNRAQQVARGIGGSVFNPDYRWSQEDYRAARGLIPWNNAIGIRNILQSFDKKFPKYSTPKRR
jgi:hypothetical protein